jgi:uncharacterized membrane protein
VTAPATTSRRLPVILAAVGLVLSILLEAIHVRAYLDPSVASFCSVDARFDCDAVALSRASVILGVPTAVWGLAGYVGLLIAAVRRSPLLLPLAATAAIFTTVMLILSLTTVGSLCLVCEAVHLVSLVLLVVAWRRRDPKGLRAITRSDAIDLAWPLMIVVLVRLFAPPYWVLASWQNGPRLDHGLTEEGLHWIGAEDPDLVVHEYVDYTCPHCALASSRTRLQVFRHSSSLQLVRHPYPRMRCSPPFPARCITARAAVCAGDQDRFWEMEDWLFANASGRAQVELEPAIEELGLDATAFDACMNDPATYERVDAEVKAAHRLKIREVPRYVIDGEAMSEAEARAVIDERL